MKCTIECRELNVNNKIHYIDRLFNAMSASIKIQTKVIKIDGNEKVIHLMNKN